MSSVALRSNVYLRSEAPVGGDCEFIQRVRGRRAIIRVLNILGVDANDRAATRRILNRRQIAELAWERRCEECGCRPEGPVLQGGSEEILFRCPLGKCNSRQRVPVQMLLDPVLVDEVCRRTGLPAPSAISHILSKLDTTTITDGALISGAKRRFTIALTPWQRYMLSEAQIESALNQFIEETAPCVK